MSLIIGKLKKGGDAGEEYLLSKRQHTFAFKISFWIQVDIRKFFVIYKRIIIKLWQES